MDEMKMSWEKKVSMREIAQFYEDKIRELDGRFQRLTEQTKALSADSQRLMDEMTVKVDKTLDERAGQKILGLNKQILNFEAKIEDLDQRAKIALDFLSKYDDVKDMIESERKISFDSMQSVFETMQKNALAAYKESTDRIVSSMKEGSMEGYIRARLEVDAMTSWFYTFLFDHYPIYFERIYNDFKLGEAHPEIYLGTTFTYVKGDPNVIRDASLSVIKGMISDYLRMFAHIKNGRDVK